MSEEPQIDATQHRQCSSCWCIKPVDQMRLNEARYGTRAESERTARWWVCTACDAHRPQQQALTAGDGTWYARERDLDL